MTIYNTVTHCDQLQYSDMYLRYILQRTLISMYNTFIKLRLNTGNRTSLSLSLRLILGIYLSI